MIIEATPLEQERFAPFGDIIRPRERPDRMINAGLCERHHDLAALDFGDGRAGISLFVAEPRRMPLSLTMVERHPLGSQAFLPLTPAPFLVIVAPDDAGRPGRPEAFVTAPQDGVNFHRGTWHGVLTPLAAPGRFAVVDRIGSGDNLEEYHFESPYTVVIP